MWGLLHLFGPERGAPDQQSLTGCEVSATGSTPFATFLELLPVADALWLLPFRPPRRQDRNVPSQCTHRFPTVWE